MIAGVLEFLFLCVVGVIGMLGYALFFAVGALLIGWALKTFNVIFWG